jgi:hypothetical protein
LRAAELVTVVASVSRPGRIDFVLANFERQTQAAHLLLALNGAARDASVYAGPWTLLRCEGGTPARPRNAGLDWVKANSAGMVSFWDDDDYYGPGYLSEVAEALRGHPRRVVGKVIRFVEFDDGVWLFLRRQGTAFLGGTMAGWASELPPIPDLPCHEDHEWCRLLERDGFELKALSGAHYIYNRKSGGHAWDATRTQMLHCYGPAISSEGGYVPRTTVPEVESEMLQSLLSRPADASLFERFETGSVS